MKGAFVVRGGWPALSGPALLLALWLSPVALPAAVQCPSPATWVDAEGQILPVPAVFDRLARESVVLLGESHDDVEHHRWQLYTLAALHSRVPSMAIGFEMFPRRVQPALDRWVAGELDEQAFLKATDWATVWGFEAEFYLPLFRFARQNAIPMVALNVERSLIRRVGEDGWDGVPEAEREGVGEPAAASAGYRRFLARIFALKDQLRELTPEAAETAEEPDESALQAALADPAFQGFVDAQLAWDRAMAEALLAAQKDTGVTMAVGVMGSGHLIHGYGVPHQLRALGTENAAKLLPVQIGSGACAELGPGYVDLAFMLPTAVPESVRFRPLLGVMVEPSAAPEGARVVHVSPGSVAERAGLQPEDVVTNAAGEALTDQADLIRVVRRQAPGTWLPLIVHRDDQRLDLVARFPMEEAGL
jgi:uncharacterized iron-regulated protein